eukprot:XP_003725801.1 PREDICTED: uncharacterized protein LOC100892561 [Strongylocentrotus purpuratus]
MSCASVTNGFGRKSYWEEATYGCDRKGIRCKIKLHQISFNGKTEQYGLCPAEGRRGSLHRPSQSRGGRRDRTSVHNDSKQPDAGAVEDQKDKIRHSGSENNIRVATWNIGSMSGRSGEVVDVMRRRKIDICCLQETRWKGGSARWLGSIGARYKFYWQGKDDGTARVGIVISETWVTQVISMDRISERAMALKLVIGSKLINILSVYAPQSGRTQEEKDTFWDQMHVIVANIPDKESIIIGGDLNGHVGKLADGYQGAHGGMGFGRRNTEGETILEFAEAMEMMIGNTFFNQTITLSHTTLGETKPKLITSW